MEKLISQLQTLLDEIEHQELGFTDVKEKLQEIVDDAHNLYDVDGYIEEENYQIVCICVSCIYGHGFDSHHLHYLSGQNSGGDWF